MICPKCKGKGEFFWDDHCQGMFMECDICNGTGEVQTNEEWLRTLPTEERVKEILSRGFMTEKRTAEELVEWLKEIHE